ncbi:MAG: hypothetical protein AAF465_09855 [Pseudomonadota bacterium]
MFFSALIGRSRPSRFVRQLTNGLLVFLVCLSLSACGNSVSGGDRAEIDPAADTNTGASDGGNNDSSGNDSGAGSDDGGTGDGGSDSGGSDSGGDDSGGGDSGGDDGGSDSGGDDSGGDNSGGDGSGDNDSGDSGSGDGGTGDSGTADGRKTYVVDADDPTASDDNDGITAPFASLQRGLDILEPGDTLIIEPAASPYRDNDSTAVDGVRGFVLNQSGLLDLPITIVGDFPTPVIDQGKTAASSDEPVVGLLLNCVSHVIVRNIEIRQTNDAGITTSLSGCTTSDITIERTLIRNVFGNHDVGGIRLANTRESQIKENRIHDVYSSSSVTSSPAVANDAVSDIRIEDNVIHSVDAGVTLRTAGSAMNAVSVRQNEFENVARALHLQADANRLGQMQDIEFLGNLVRTSESVLDSDLDRAGTQSQGVKVFNNTFVDVTGPALNLNGIALFENYNNLFVRPGADLLVSQRPFSPSIQNSIAYSDNNMVWQGSGPAWTLDLGTLTAYRFVGLPAWQTALSDFEGGELSINPDQSTIWADPDFVNETNGDFTPQNPATLGTGRYGGNIGAFND